MDDQHLMAIALRMGHLAMGRTWPNPPVGCVLFQPSGLGQIVARAHTAGGGRPHAETQALAIAGKKAQGATAAITLEPCNHQGQTSPCSQALIDARVKRVVIGSTERNPQATGGIKRLRQANIEVTTGILEKRTDQLAAGFFHHLKKSRPLVTVKMAATLDGRVGLNDKKPTAITQSQAHLTAHCLRGQADALGIGIGTILTDNPQLNIRLPGVNQTLLRVIFDSKLRTPANARLFDSIGCNPVWIVTATDPDSEPGQRLIKRGATILPVKASQDKRLCLKTALETLGTKGLTHLLVEGGPILVSALLNARLANHYLWFQARSLLGDEHEPALKKLTFSGTKSIQTVEEVTQPCGQDMLSAGHIVYPV